MYSLPSWADDVLNLDCQPREPIRYAASKGWKETWDARLRRTHHGVAKGSFAGPWKGIPLGLKGLLDLWTSAHFVNAVVLLVDLPQTPSVPIRLVISTSTLSTA